MKMVYIKAHESFSLIREQYAGADSKNYQSLFQHHYL